MKKSIRLLVVLMLGTTLFTMTSCHTTYSTRGSNGYNGKEVSSSKKIKGNGIPITQTRTVEGTFEKIEVSAGIDAIVSQNDPYSISVLTDENVQSLISTKLENGVLLVTANSSFRTEKSPEVRVSLPIISGLQSSSGASIKGVNTLKSKSLILSSSSGSDIKLDVDVDFISLESTSGSDIEISGKAIKMETSSTSGSDIDAGKLIADEVYAQATSGSSTKIYPVTSLKGKATSGADIKYKNVPKNLEKQESSGGSVDKD